MDRQLSKEEIRKTRLRLWLRLAVVFLVAGLAVAAVVAFTGRSVGTHELWFGTVDCGDVESCVQATGKVVPGFEEIITSPIASRIVEIYGHAGDKVEEGTPLLRLDLTGTETEIEKLRDSRRKLLYDIEQQELSNVTELNNIAMEIKVKEMAVDHLEAEVENEKKLDALGSGTGDKVREAELAYRTTAMQLEQLRQRYDNERRMRASAIEARRLDLSIADRNLATQERTLDDARLKSPRAATLTYISSDIGRQVSAGEKIASVADLSTFKIAAEISETNARLLAIGGKASVKISKNIYAGTVVNVSPVSTDGAVSFSVVLDDNAASNLRAGLKGDVFVVRDVKADVLRLPIGPYYNRGAGEYELFVRTSPGTLERRRVSLGDAGYNYVEVRSGLDAGDEVVLGDMSSFKSNKLKLK